MEQYDAIVIGSGQAGTPLCKKLAEAGLKTALIEERWIAGTCVNDGCSPTKTLIASAKAAWDASHHKTLGVDSGKISLDFEKIMARKNEVVQTMRSNSEKAIRKTQNLDWIKGSAAFSGPKEVTVTQKNGHQQILKAEMIFINTGLKPVIPDIPGIEDIDYHTSTSILDIDSPPGHLLVLGSGYIGIEFAQMFRRFGSKVTIIEPSERILRHEDEDMTTELQNNLEDEEIDIRTNTEVTGFSKTKSGISAVTVSGGKEKNITCSHLLIATGREPHTDLLHPDKAGIKTDEKGFIQVDDQLQTNVKGIYALGDVKGGPAFTHISFDDYRIISKNIIDKKKASTADRLVPYCIFTDPQLGRVGITEQEAREKKLDIQVFSIVNEAVARAIETGDTRGLMKAVVDKKSGKILGAAVLAEQGGEIITILQMAMLAGMTYEQIRDGVFAHPTYAESLNNLFMSEPNS